jgi:hypothetical protein
MNYIDNPVFICGHRKAGTTLLINLLDGIEDAIVYPDDSGFFYMYYPFFDTREYSDKEKINRLCNRVAKENLGEVIDRQNVSSKVKDKLHNKQKIFIRELRKIQKNNFTTKDILTHFIESFGKAFQSHKNPKFWVEKTTSSEIYALEIKKWFPRAKFIHILRDPRDNWSSMLSGWDKRYDSYNPSKKYLINSMIERGKLGFQMAIDNTINIGNDSYLVIKYEDLVTNPIEIMKKISNFLCISYSEILLSPTTFGLSWNGNNFSGMDFNGISANSVGKWKSRITEADAMLIEYYFYDSMKKFGYEAEFDRVSCQKQAIEHYKWYNFSDKWSEK